MGLREYTHLRFAVESKVKNFGMVWLWGKVSISIFNAGDMGLKVGMVVLRLFLTLVFK